MLALQVLSVAVYNHYKRIHDVSLNQKLVHFVLQLVSVHGLTVYDKSFIQFVFGYSRVRGVHVF